MVTKPLHVTSGKTKTRTLGKACKNSLWN